MGFSLVRLQSPLNSLGCILGWCYFTEIAIYKQLLTTCQNKMVVVVVIGLKVVNAMTRKKKLSTIRISTFSSPHNHR